MKRNSFNIAVQLEMFIVAFRLFNQGSNQVELLRHTLHFALQSFSCTQF